MEIIINDVTEFDNLIASEKVVMADFWATWCGPCRMLMPTVEKLSEEADGKYAVAKVNVDANEDLTDRYGIVSIPTLLFFKNGELVEKSVGVKTEEQIKEVLNKYTEA